MYRSVCRQYLILMFNVPPQYIEKCQSETEVQTFAPTMKDYKCDTQKQAGIKAKAKASVVSQFYNTWPLPIKGNISSDEFCIHSYLGAPWNRQNWERHDWWCEMNIVKSPYDFCTVLYHTINRSSPPPCVFPPQRSTSTPALGVLEVPMYAEP